MNSSVDLSMETERKRGSSSCVLTSVRRAECAALKRTSECRSDSIVADDTQNAEGIREDRIETPRPSLLQIMLVVFGSLGHLAMGMGVAWPNVLASSLAMENSTLAGDAARNMEKMDLVGSLMYCGLIVGVLPSGVVVTKLGRRFSLIPSALLMAAGWLIIAVTEEFLLIYTGRFVGGIGVSLLLLAVRTYMVEISNTSIRGFVVAYLDVMKCLGNFVVAGLAVVLPWYWVAALISSVSLMFAVVIAPFFPESPRFLLLQGRKDDAKSVLRRLRADKFDVEKELARIGGRNQNTDGSSWKALLLPENRKSIATICGLFLFTSFSGGEVVRVNMTRMLQISGMTIDPATNTFIVMGVSLIGSISFSLLVDRIGRRWCLMSTMALATVAYIVLGLHAFLTSGTGTYVSQDIEVVQLHRNTSTVPYLAGDAAK